MGIAFYVSLLEQEPIQAHHRGLLKQPNEQEGKQTQNQSRAEGLLIQEGHPQSCQNMKDITVVKSLEYIEALCSVDKSLLPLLSILNGLRYTNYIVNLSKN